jgi:hypothetical protein
MLANLRFTKQQLCQAHDMYVQEVWVHLSQQHYSEAAGSWQTFSAHAHSIDV